MLKHRYLLTALLGCFAGAAAAQAPALPTRVSLPELYQALKAARIDKKADEEKTAMFDARRQSFRFKKLGIGDEMMVVFRPGSTPGCERSVDADHDVFGFYCNFQPQTHEAHGVEAIVSQSQTDSSYIGANAFNRKVKVVRRDVNRVSLLLTHVDNNSVFIKNAASLAVSDIPSGPGKFRQDYEQLEVGLVFTLRPPFIDSFISGTDPTISNPVDLTIRTRAVVGLLKRVHILRKGVAMPSGTFVPDEYKSWDGALVNLSFSKLPAEE